MNPGKYIGTVLHHRVDQSPVKGTWYVNVLFELENSMGKIGGNIWMTDSSKEIARKSLKAIGFDPDVYEVSILDSNPVFLAGNRAQVDIQEKPNQKTGEMELVVAWINPLSAPKSGDSLKQLTMMLRSAKSKDKTPAPAPPANAGEDIPF